MYIQLSEMEEKYVRNQRVHIQKYVQGDHCDMLKSKRIFWAEKFISQA